MINKIEKKLKNKQAHIDRLTKERDALLRELRLQCKHLRIVELEYQPSEFDGCASPPRHICTTCGAEEEGWGCGYQVLDFFFDKEGRRVIKVLKDPADFYEYRKKGPLYFVGQSHPNWGPGRKTYEQLTEIKEE